MHINIKTIVKKTPEQVFEKFDKDLFIKLKPPGIGLKILRFDGCNKGDIVELELNFGLFKQKWISRISESVKTENEIFFVDEAYGKDLPFFLKSWKHKHIIRTDSEGTAIIDDIHYKAPVGLNFLSYPAIFFQMWYRKPVYKKEFNSENVTDRI